MQQQAAAALAAIVEHEAAAEAQLNATTQSLVTLRQQLTSDRDKLYRRRQELVSGKALPTSEEAAAWDADSGAQHAQQQHGASVKGVPHFWLTALMNQDSLAEEISSRDKQALSYCTAVAARYPANGGPPTLELSFSANPFFSNSQLRRCLGAEAGGSSGGVPEVTTDIAWKDNAHKLTVREVVKKGGSKSKGGKGKKGGKGGRGGGADDGDDEVAPAAARRVTYRPCDSFFSFFLAEEGSSGGRRGAAGFDPTLPHAGSDDEGGADDDEPERSAKQEADERIMRLVLDKVLPHAATLYMNGPLQSPSDEDDDDFQVVNGLSGSSPHDLPPAVRRVLAALQHNQAALDALAAEWQRQRSKLKAQQAKLRSELAQQRRSLLLPVEGQPLTVERFWLRVLRTADAAALAISPRDAAVLASLADVRFSLDSSEDGSELHGRLELEFLPNAHLTGSTLLIKSFSFDPATDTMLASKVVAAPSWASPAVDPTHKAGRDGKQRPASSIFQLFKQGGGKYAFNLTGDPKEVQAEANELETELLFELHDHLLLKAAHEYLRAAADGWADDDDAAGDEAAWAAAAAAADAADSGSESDAEDGEDEGEAAHKAAARRSKEKHGGFKLTKGGVLVLLMAMMLLGELLMLLDFLRRR